MASIPSKNMQQHYEKMMRELANGPEKAEAAKVTPLTDARNIAKPATF